MTVSQFMAPNTTTCTTRMRPSRGGKVASAAAVCLPRRGATPRCRPAHTVNDGQRKGLATLWAILTIPIALLVLGLVIEVSHLWLARAELQSGLEAAALAGVKRWADESTANNHATPGALTITNPARIAAQAAAAGNTVAGSPLVLGLNQTPGLDGDGNNQTGFDNASCAGDIVLGGFPTTNSTIFVTNAAVGCGRSQESTEEFEISFNLVVETGGMGNDSTQNTSNVPNAFRVGFTTASPGISLTQVQINLQNGGGSGVFHPNPVQPDPMFSGNEATGNGPTVHNTSAVPAADVNFSFNMGNTVMTIDVTPGVWTSGETLIFGVDTDGVRVSSNPGMHPANVDTGGNFGDTGGGAMSTADEVLFSFAFTTPSGTSSAQPFDKKLQRLGTSTSRLLGVSQNFTLTVTIVIPDVDFAVMAQKSMTVSPLFKQLFGVPISDFTISGRAIATARCVGANSVLVQNPQSVYFTDVNCN